MKCAYCMVKSIHDNSNNTTVLANGLGMYTLPQCFTRKLFFLMQQYWQSLFNLITLKKFKLCELLNKIPMVSMWFSNLFWNDSKDFGSRFIPFSCIDSFGAIWRLSYQQLYKLLHVWVDSGTYMWYSGKQPTSRICAPDDCSSSNL